MRLRLNVAYKTHVIISLIISLWLVIFLVLIAPFDAADLSFRIRLVLMPFYGVISFCSYLILIPLQNWIFHKVGKWTLLLEILFTLLFHLLVLMGSFAYYQSSWMNGDYSLQKFTFHVYYPIFFILLTILIALRWFLFKKTADLKTDKIVLKGENKLDALHIPFSDLVSVSSADNYVEVSYLVNQVLQKKLLRNTLKSIAADHTGLLKVHRSHLINPIHFIEWKDASTLQLTQMEVPVSSTYKKAILALENHL